MVDRLSAKTKKDLSLPESAQEELDRGVADVTTHSPEAYRYYIEGVDYLRKVYHAEAEASFKKALELDSTFAMVYYRLSSIVEASDQRAMIAKALEYSDKISWREQHYIKSQEALLSADYFRAIEELEKIVPGIWNYLNIEKRYSKTKDHAHSNEGDSNLVDGS